jgi:hypothetical protein
MKKPALPQLLAAAAFFAATSGALADSADSSHPPAVRPLKAAENRPGYGVVESIAAVRIVRATAPSASAGSSEASRGGSDRPAFRVGVRMADGSLQYRDVYRPEYGVGDNVLLTNAGDVVPD